MTTPNPLQDFVKGFLGFYGSGGDGVLAPLILASQQSLAAAGVPEPTDNTELYYTAVALQTKIILDGDEKGHLTIALTAIVLQLKEYSDVQSD